MSAQKKATYLEKVTAGCAHEGLDLPVAEFRFHSIRKWRFDFAWERERVALEIDGGVWSGGRHGRGSGIVKEHEKFNAAASLGWLIFRCTPQALDNPELWQLIHLGLKS